MPEVAMALIVLGVIGIVIALFWRWLFAKPECCGKTMVLAPSPAGKEIYRCEACGRQEIRDVPTGKDIQQAVENRDRSLGPF